MKKFLIKAAPFLLFIFISISYFSYMSVHVSQTGDLGRLDYIYFDEKYRDSLMRSPYTDMMVDEYSDTTSMHYDVMVIGDSFSQQGIYGYQNFLAHKLKKRIINVHVNSSEHPEQVAVKITKAHNFKKISPKILIIETVERGIVKRVLGFRDQFGDSVYSCSTNIQSSVKRITPRYFSMVKSLFLQERERPVRKEKLISSFFSYKNKGNLLYFYSDDIQPDLLHGEKLSFLNKMDSIGCYFNNQCDMFIYMMASDKYDAYRPYFINKTSHFLDDLKINSSFFFNSRDSIRPMLPHIKDFYYYDDSHWSPKGAEIIADLLYRKISKQY